MNVIRRRVPGVLLAACAAVVPTHARAVEGRAVALGEAWTPIDPARLAGMRGGFQLPSGQLLSFGIERVVYVNDVAVVRTSVRIPDVAFLSMEKFPNGRFPKGAIAPLAPDLAVEVLSPSNTKQEMNEKLSDYFSHGARLVWYVDPETRTIDVFTGLRLLPPVGGGVV